MTTPAAPPEPPVSLFAGVLSYLVPGLGQIWQGRVAKGIVFMVCLLSLFHLGHRMGDGKNVYVPISEGPPYPEGRPDELTRFRLGRLRQLPFNLYQRWHFLGQFWIGVSAWPALWQYFEMPLPTKEVENIPGARVPDAFWFNLQRCPSESAINEFWVASDKTPDLGWIYTVIAGVLNILVIYDAYAGPAFRSDPREAKPEAKKDGKPQEAQA